MNTKTLTALMTLLTASAVWALDPIPSPRSLVRTGGARPYAAPTESIDPSLPAEGYRLTVTPEKITLTAGSAAGLFYGRGTLEQLSAPGGKTVPCVTIEDAPRLKLRGFMHDTGRNFQTVESLKKQLDIFARYRLNVFHWHLTDNPAWRIESKRYPQLNTRPSRQDGRTPEGTYTFDQIREVIAYAKARHIRVIPELDMPGHSACFNRAFGFSMGSPKGIAILKELLTEFCSEIPAADCPIIHIGSDEVHIPHPKAFIAAMETHLASLGRRAAVWSPGLVPSSKSTITQLWKSNARLPQDGAELIDSSFGYLNTYDPQELVRRYLSAAIHPKALGATLCCWPDVRVDDKTKIFSQNAVWPALLAFSENAWSGPADLTAFEPKLEAHRDAYFAGMPFDYIPQMRHSWTVRIGKYSPGIRRGASFMFGASNNRAKKEGTETETAILTATVSVPEAGTYLFRAGFEAPARSNRLSYGIPEQGRLDAAGGTVLFDGSPLPAPVYREPGRFSCANNMWHGPLCEVPYADEQFWWLRTPSPIFLTAGTHTVTITAPRKNPKMQWSATLLPVRWADNRWVDDKRLTFTAAATK